MNRHAWMLLHAVAAAAAAACMRACAAAHVIDTMYQLIYSSAQTQAWRMEFSYSCIGIFADISRGQKDELETPCPVDF
jgi:hypothetical protein